MNKSLKRIQAEGRLKTTEWIIIENNIESYNNPSRDCLFNCHEELLLKH